MRGSHGSDATGAWANGETGDRTNIQYLLPGGIYPQHLADFNAILHRYFG